MPKFMIHAEWKERVPGKLLLQQRERTVERMARDISVAHLEGKRLLPPTAVGPYEISIRQFPNETA